MLTPDICVIGAGSAGLTVAAAARSFGHSVVLLERGAMGGDCLNYGCIPSKALIAAARHAAAARDGARFGIHAEPLIDYAQVAEHVRGVIAAIAPHDSVERFEGLGVTVIQASARFVDARTVEAGSETIRARRFVIATGSSPVVPPIPGLAEAAPLTNETVFDLRVLPPRLGIIGGGAIGAELAQAFARLGSAVVVVEGGRFLAKEDPDAVAVVREALLRDGVRLIEGTRVERVDGGTLHLSGGETVEVDRILVAAGRRPNVDGLGLEAAGIEAGEQGIVVDQALRTTNRRVWAIGDIAGGLQFTHVAGHQASLVVRAIVFRLPVRYDPDVMPRALYTDPELAQVGPTEAEARKRDPGATATIAPLARNDRAQTAGETKGFVKLVVSRGRLVGATIVSPNAGELAATYQLALAAKVKLSAIASFTPAYPTLAEAGKRAAVDHFAPAFQRPWVRRVLRLLKRL